MRHIWLLLCSIGLAGSLFIATLAASDLAPSPTTAGTTQATFTSGWAVMSSCGATGATGGWRQSATARKPLTIEQAQHQIQLYLDQFPSQAFTVDEIMEFQHNFYAIVGDTSTGHAAFEVLVNKWTGRVSPEYGPDMMWNTRYGMIRGGEMGLRCPTGPLTISPRHARAIALRWLATHRAGATIDAVYQFPGYYTVHFSQNGISAGMFSVNGYTGDVWYHTWHGRFIRMRVISG